MSTLGEDDTQMKQAITTASAPQPAGPYSQAIRAGDFLFVAGQGPTDPRTGKAAGDDIQTQTRQVLQNVKTIVEAAGGSMANVVRVNAYLTDLSNFAAYNEVYREFFPEP